MTSVHVVHQFDDARQQFDAARLGMWIFLATEVLFFGGMFTGYAYYRALYPAAFVEGSKHLDLALGTINTAVLLASSLTMALAVRGVQTDHPRLAAVLLVATVALGTVFLGIKGYEYFMKYVEHHVPGSAFELGEVFDKSVNPSHVELFFSFYLSMTGLHAAHMILGIGIVKVISLWTLRQSYSSGYYTPVEITGLYWHFVDIVWVFLFPLLYLVR
jgi:cytochrome c oxidase subunit III